MILQVMVWAGLLGTHVIGPYYFQNENVNAVSYLRLLQDHIVPDMLIAAAAQGIPAGDLWFQQDGAPPHYATAVRDYLDQTFPGRWIGRRGPIEWPARSPDMAPLDFYFWGNMKGKVYSPRPPTLQALIDTIGDHARLIQPDELERVQREFYDRLGYCISANGEHFEQLIQTKKRYRDEPDSD
jgi:hypothetical protein